MKLILTFFLLHLFVCAFTQVTNTKPTTYYIVNINNTEYEIKEGEDLTIDSTLVNPVINVKIAPYRNFDIQAISFDYPSHYSYDYSGDGPNSWTLTGNDFVIMFFELNMEAGLDEFIDEMVKQFGKKNTKTENLKLKLGNRNLSGKKLLVKLAGQTLEMQILSLENNENKTRLLVFQDSLNEDGSSSAEKNRTINLINQSIEYR